MLSTEHPPIELAAASKIYPGGVQALSAVSFAIAAGERACLLGPNGAGKTTLIRLLTGALSPSDGTARLFGATATDAAFLEAKRRVGIVPQAAGMYRDVRVREYLELVRQLYGCGTVAEAMELFGLQPYADRPMAELSGGFQRRLALAAAVLPQPDLLLLDEPTVGLDPLAAREVHAFLRSMMAGRTTLLCTHNLDEAEALCDSVVILRGGHVLLHQPLEQLRARAQPHVQLAATEGAPRLREELERLGYQPQQAGELVRIAVSEPQQVVPQLLQTLLAGGLHIYECHVLKPSLEDLFVEAVGGKDAHP